MSELVKRERERERERVALSDIGNCDICAELKISFVNEMKRNENFPRPKG